MSDKDHQKIAVLLSLKESDNTLIPWGVKMASLFRKELCLVSFLKKDSDKEKCNALLAGYMAVVCYEMPDLPVSTLLLKSTPKNAPLLLADQYEAILLIAPSSQFKKYSKGLAGSPIPFLFTGKILPEANRIEKIVVPVDLRKGNNDAGLWASYFGRFHKSEVLILVANDKNAENKKLVTRNVAFITALLNKFSVDHRTFRGEKGSFGILFEALNLSKKIGANLLIITGSSSVSIIDLLIGLPEQKMVEKAEDLPVLIINPRKDMYVMCE